MENLITINAENCKERFPLVVGERTFGARYKIDADGNLWDANSGDEIPWQREAHAELSMSSKTRTETAGKRKFSKLLADDGTLVTVGRAEAVACSVPEVAAKRKPGTVVVFQDGDRANETAANLTWGSPQDMLAKVRATKPGKVGGSSSQILSDLDVKEILSAYNPHDQGNNSRAFADRFGVAQTTINNVISNKTFVYIDRAQFASNPHIKQEKYFDSYVPGEGTILYKRYVEMGKILPTTTATEASVEATATDSSTEANTIGVENKEESNHAGL